MGAFNTIYIADYVKAAVTLTGRKLVKGTTSL